MTGYVRCPWYVNVNDLVGGWIVSTEDKPASTTHKIIAEFYSEDHARHVADLHNAWLREIESERYR